MITSEKRVRHLIRSIILEQVVGYQAPKTSYDDPLGDEDHSFSTPTGKSGGSEAVTGKPDDDSSGYMQIGDISVPTGKEDAAAQKTAGANLSSQDKNQMRSQMTNLQRQRQSALDKGNAKSADYYGTQMQRIKNILNPV